MAKKTYEVLSRIDADRRYEPGESIEMDERHAAPLLGVELRERPADKNPGAPKK